MKSIDDVYKKEFSAKLNALFGYEKWEEAIIILEKEIKKYPEEYFLHTSLAKTYFNLKIYDKAYDSALKAMAIEPNDPLVIYDYACTLYSLGKYIDATVELNKIVDQNIKDILNSKFGEGVKWVKSLINDSRFRMALCYIELGKIAIALELINKHLQHRQRGIYSDFTKKQVLKKQTTLL